MSAELAVVIPTHQRRELLLQVLAAVAAQTLPPTRFQVVVVCDGCSDGSPEAARQAAAPGGAAAGLDLTVMEQPNSGAATARNRGAAACDAPLLLFIDDDMIAAPDLAEAHLTHHRSRPGSVVLGAMPVHPDSPPGYLTEGLRRWADRRHALLSDPARPVPTDEVLTGQMSMSRETFHRLGGFDVRFTAGGTFGGEDIEFGWRARRLGIPVVYEPRAVTRQIYRKTFRALCRNIRDAGAADALMAAKHPEIRAELPLGQVENLSAWQRRTHQATLRAPRLTALALAPALAALEAAARLGLGGELWEKLHGVARAHLYARGMQDAAVEAAALAAAASGSRTA